MAFDQVPEQDSAKIFLVDLDSHVPVKTSDFGETS